MFSVVVPIILIWYFIGDLAMVCYLQRIDKAAISTWLGFTVRTCLFVLALISVFNN